MEKLNTKIGHYIFIQSSHVAKKSESKHLSYRLSVFEKLWKYRFSIWHIFVFRIRSYGVNNKANVKTTVLVDNIYLKNLCSFLCYFYYWAPSILELLVDFNPFSNKFHSYTPLKTFLWKDIFMEYRSGSLVENGLNKEQGQFGTAPFLNKSHFRK